MSISLELDANLLLSIINTKLRDYYNNISILCEEEDISERELVKKLENINYIYDQFLNQFISK